MARFVAAAFLVVMPSGSAHAQAPDLATLLEQQRHFQVTEVECSQPQLTNAYMALFPPAVGAFRPIDVARTAPDGGEIVVTFHVDASGHASALRVTRNSIASQRAGELAIEFVTAEARIFPEAGRSVDCSAHLRIPPPLRPNARTSEAELTRCLSFCTAYNASQRRALSFPEGSCGQACIAGTVDPRLLRCPTSDAFEFRACVFPH